MKKEQKICYCYDKDGYFVGTDSDYGQPLPVNSTYEVPVLQTGFIPHWNGTAWEQAENHKGEKGYVNGQHIEIEEYGPYPEGWSAEPPPPPPDTRTPEEKRQAAYLVELDPIRDRIDGYKTEAEALRADGDNDRAIQCDEKAAAFLKDFLAKKHEIRERFPDTGE